MAAELRFSRITKVDMAAGTTDQSVLGGKGCRSCGNCVVLQAEQGPFHLVGVALVIDQRVGAKFTDAHKAWAGDVSATAHLFAGARDVGHQRQSREVVTRHEALAGQVAVSAEVVVVSAAGLISKQQLLLHPCCP